MGEEQTLLLCDEDGVVTGHAPRSLCHAGDGLLHRAIHAVLLDAEGRVLMQRRRSGLWDGIWDATCATHLLHLGERDESTLEATRRCVAAEWGVEAALRERFSFVYHAREGEHAEHEYCTLLTGILGSPPVLQPDYAYELAWEDAGVLAMRMRTSPDEFTPWSRVAVERLFPEKGQSRGMT